MTFPQPKILTASCDVFIVRTVPLGQSFKKGTTWHSLTQQPFSRYLQEIGAAHENTKEICLFSAIISKVKATATTMSHIFWLSSYLSLKTGFTGGDVNRGEIGMKTNHWYYQKPRTPSITPGTGIAFTHKETTVCMNLSGKQHVEWERERILQTDRHTQFCIPCRSIQRQMWYC